MEKTYRSPIDLQQKKKIKKKELSEPETNDNPKFHPPQGDINCMAVVSRKHKLVQGLRDTDGSINITQQFENRTSNGVFIYVITRGNYINFKKKYDKDMKLPRKNFSLQIYEGLRDINQ